MLIYFAFNMVRCLLWLFMFMFRTTTQLNLPNANLRTLINVDDNNLWFLYSFKVCFCSNNKQIILPTGVLVNFIFKHDYWSWYCGICVSVITRRFFICNNSGVNTFHCKWHVLTFLQIYIKQLCWSTNEFRQWILSLQWHIITYQPHMYPTVPCNPFTYNLGHL